MNRTRPPAVPWFVTALVLAGLVAAGCNEPPPPPQRIAPPPEFFSDPGPAELRPQSRMQLPGYRLNFGDELEIIYQVRSEVTAHAYKLQIEDTIIVRFPFQPELDQRLTIPSDGNVHFLLIEEPIRVEGETVAELSTKLRDKYQPHIKKPVLTVIVEQANVKISELKKTISTSPRGQSRLVPVAPDGRISLPYVTDIMAYGLTVPELIDALNKAYAAANIEGIEVTVDVLNVAPLKVYIMGEVSRPGLHNLRHHATLTQAIGSAGGWIRGRADASKVLLIRRRGMPTPTGAILNVAYLTQGLGDQALADKPVDFAAHRFDPFIQDDDIIYVPSNQLAKNADWLKIVFTEGLHRVVPFGASAGYTVSDSVDWLKPNP